ncbi:MAG: ATP-binding cassette domain-containing protein [Maribacter sp.]|nr:ATP-binding cassette domain-containing protein [Maribacter sp.]
MKATQRFFKFLELDRKDISYIYVYAILSGLITLSLPLGIQAMINLMVGGEISSSLFLLIGIVTLGVAFTGFLTVMQLTVTETIQRRIFSRSAFEFAWRIPRLKLENISEIYPPELINRFFDTVTLQKGIPKILIDFSTAVLQIVFGLILLSLYHPFFVFFGIILIISLIIIFRFSGRSGLQTSLMESNYKYKVAHWLEELGRAMNVFKLSVPSNLPIQRTDDLVCNYLDARKSHFKILMLQYGSVVLFKTLITAALLILGSILVIRNQISIGQFVAAEIIVILILNSAEKLILSMENIYNVLTALEKIGFVTDLPLEDSEGIKLQEIETDNNDIEIQLDNVSFQFNDSNKKTLNDISLRISQGEKILLSGYNGSGKSTLIKILGGLLTNYEGTISFNGINLRSLDLNSVRKEIGILSSKDEIFSSSILENLTFGNVDIPFSAIIKVTKEIGLHEYINDLPEGYSTQLLADGLNIPQSIISKMILARTLIRNPRILILDNFMPRLEQREKGKIMEYLTDSKKPWTVIILSYNGDYATKCDRVIILDKGEIIEDAHYQNLKSKNTIENIFRVTPQGLIDKPC